MENELRHFFLTVANYSLPENAGKYLESLTNTPKKPKHCYDYARWLYPSLAFKLGLYEYPPGSILKKLYELKGFSGENDRCTEAELNSFEQRRKVLISVLGQVVSGRPLTDIEGLSGLLLTASQLTRDDQFNLGDEGVTNGEMPLYPWTPKERRRSTPAVVKPEKTGRVLLACYNVLPPVFNLACYGLSVFLADSKRGGKDRIKKCPICKHFFSANDKKRKFCYPPKECEKINKNKWQRDFMRNKRDKNGDNFDPDYI